MVVPTSWPRAAIPVPIVVEQLGRKRPRPDPGRVGLHDADDLVDLERADPAAGAGAAGDRVRRGHERVGAVVEVEQRALGALEQDVVAARERVLDEPRRVGEVRREALAPGERLLDERVDLERSAALERRQQQRSCRAATRASLSRRRSASRRSSIRRPIRDARSA